MTSSLRKLPATARPAMQPALPMKDIKGGAERVLFVLATLAKLERSVSMTDLVAATGLPQSTLYRQLALLKRWGFVIDNNNEYSPGPMCLPLAWGFDQSSFLIQAAHTELKALAKASGESIGLLVTVKNQAVCLDMIESLQPLRCSFVKGRSLPLSKGASAKALLAFMGTPQRAAALEWLCREQITGPQESADLEAELDRIRAQGYAITDSEVDVGVWGISAPIFQQARHAAAVVSLMAPNTRINNRTQSFIDMTVRVASRISSRLQSL
jgi:DNA-binding IclR family transcriptional regulator